MSGARVRAEAYVQPKNHRPYKDPAQLHYRDNRELVQQLTTYVRTKWTTADRVDIDVRTMEVMVDGVAVANFAIHEPVRRGADQLAADL